MENFIHLRIGEMNSLLSKDLFINGIREVRENMFYDLLRLQYQKDILHNLRDKDIVILKNNLVEYINLQNIIDIEPEICKLNEDGTKDECL